VLGYNVEEIIAPKVRYLAEVAGAGREGAAAIILARPARLRLSIDRNLRPTLRFVEDNFPDTSLAVTMSLTGYSLAGRLMPRVRLLHKHDQAGRFAASTIARCTNETFCEKVGITIEEYDAEVAACVREHAEKHPGPETVAGVGGEGGGEGAVEIAG